MKKNIYLDRYAYPKSYFQLETLTSPDLIVVIPCREEPGLLATLRSLSAAGLPRDCNVGVLVLINHSEAADPAVRRFNEQTLSECQTWIDRHSHDRLVIQAALAALPKKHAGVGLARKIGMDDAVRAFEASGKEGLIVCLDADCTVDPNYFTAIWQAYQKYHFHSASICFEHHMPPAKTEEGPDGILLYELYLRYYIDALRFAGYPRAVQTIGSSMAVSSAAYQRCGGMNRRKAGEDFYFIHKLLPLGRHIEINETTVRPSGRISHRVPFGTGAAIGKWAVDPSTLELSYNFRIFEVLKAFFAIVHRWSDAADKELKMQIDQLPGPVHEFLRSDNGLDMLLVLRDATATPGTFKKQFWNYFDGLKVLKFVHFASDKHYPKIPIGDCLDWLFDQYVQADRPPTLEDALLSLREFDRTSTAQKGL